MALNLFVNNDNMVQLLGLTDHASGAFQNTATVTVTLLDRHKVIVAGPITMGYVSGSNGDYEGIIPGDTVLTVGQSYRAKIHATSGSGIAEWFMPAIVEYRES